jgi:hypothetical protein
MRRKTVVLGVAAACAAAIAVGGIAVAAGNDGEGSVTGPEAQAATRAALRATHGGTANAVERDSENGATWEVEVTKPDGDTVDVRLDRSYHVVVVEGDSEATDGSGADDG